MAYPQSSFIIKRYDGFGGNFTDSQYLGATYDIRPHVFENQITQIFSSKTNLYTGKLLANLTMGKAGRTIEIDDEIYRWYLQGAEEKTARVVENLESSNTTPGINKTLIRVKLDLDYFSAPDVLMGEDNEYPLAVVDKFSDGTGTIYTLQLQTDNPALFVPASMFEVGKEFSKVWTSVASEMNSEFGTQQYPSSYKLESQVGAFAQKYTVTDKAWRQEGRIGVTFMYTDQNGKTVTARRFLPMAEAKMWNELYTSIEAQLVYGKKHTSSAANGYWKKTGPGLREYLKDSWLQYYNGPLSISQLKDFLLDIQVTRVSETERINTAITGTLGAQLFHDALVSVSNGYLTVDSNFINKISSDTSTPHLAFGAQFTRYNGPHGLQVNMMLNSMNDSRKYSKIMHPLYPNLPVDSARMTFLNLGSTEGQPNMAILKVKDSYRWGFRAGTHTQLIIAA
jgi:hypothetical protein